uniref:Candidate secreted effector n=1 Tax=Meloidogyne incognita TaxID=6306 RepID=A0A914KFJ7_MELIC
MYKSFTNFPMLYKNLKIICHLNWIHWMLFYRGCLIGLMENWTHCVLLLKGSY